MPGISTATTASWGLFLIFDSKPNGSFHSARLERVFYYGLQTIEQKGSGFLEDTWRSQPSSTYEAIRTWLQRRSWIFLNLYTSKFPESKNSWRSQQGTRENEEWNLCWCSWNLHRGSGIQWSFPITSNVLKFLVCSSPTNLQPIQRVQIPLSIILALQLRQSYLRYNLSVDKWKAVLTKF